MFNKLDTNVDYFCYTCINMVKNENRSIFQKLLLSCGIAGSVFFTSMYLVEGAIHPGYSLLRETISSLELVRYGWMQQANFIIFGLFIVCFAIGIHRELKGNFGGMLFPLLQVMVAIGVIISGVFIHEPLHTTGDFITFLSMVAGFFVMAVRFTREPQWKGWALYSVVSAVLLMTFLAMFGNALSHGGPAGLFERLAGLVRSVWTIILVTRLFYGATFSHSKKLDTIEK